MKKLLVVFLYLASFLTLSAQSRSESIDKEMIDGFRARAGSVFDTRFLEDDMLRLTIDTAMAASMDTSCTYRVMTRGITDQMKSGRCWFFSTLNILRAEMINKYDLADFQFSQTYGQFWDVLEKSNRFLENVMEFRNKPLDSRMNEWLFKKPIGDGGHFANAAHIISKYGIVPQEVMPERHSSTENLRLMIVVRTILRKYGLKLRDAEKSDLQSIKEEALYNVYRVLVQNLGEPPTEFRWALKDRNGKVLSDKTYTPASFRDEFVRHDMENDYVIFMDDPTKPYYRMYEVDNSRNCFEMSNWTFLNVPANELEAMGIESLKGGDMFYFSADTDTEAMMMEGIYGRGIYDLEEELGIDIYMTKEEMVRSCEIKSVHAMAMAGVQLDEDGKPVKWLIENSFGTARGWDGFVVMQAEWLRTYIFRMAVEEKYVPDHLKKYLKQKPKRLKSWNPIY